MSLLREKNGQLSTARLLSILLVVCGIIYLFVTRDNAGTTILLSFGTGTKLIQKPFEKK